MKDKEDKCCIKMKNHASFRCDIHADKFECPDSLIDIRDSGTYAIIIHDGGTSGIEINFCPWCGARLTKN